MSRHAGSGWRPPPWVLDVAGAVVFLGASVAEMGAAWLPSRPGLLLFVPAFTVPLLWRRRAPLSVLVVVLAVVSLVGLVDAAGDYLTPFAAVLFALYSAGAHSPRGKALVALSLVLGFFTIGTALDNLRVPGSRPVGDLMYMAGLNTVIWALARLVYSWRRQARELAQRTVELEREREWRAQAAVTEERTRIARELHDVIAHSVSLMVVQAAAGEEMLDLDPERAREPMRNIQRAGRQSVLELRRLLGILRPADDGPDSLSPQPTLGDLPALVKHSRDAGLVVDLHVEGDARPLPPGIEMAAYRVVQEALTNVVKHAGQTAAEVVVRYGDEALDIDVVNNGHGHGNARPPDGTGLGLVGMRERVTLYGGSLDAGPRHGGGFRVHAHIPLSRHEP